MKIGVLADVHGNLGALESAWRALGLESVDLVVNLGDLVHFGPSPDECVAFAREHTIDSIQGNCDRAVARGRASTGDFFVNSHWERLSDEVLEWTASRVSKAGISWLRGLPEELRFEFEGMKLLFTHGLPGNIAGSLPRNAAMELYDLLLSRNGCDVLVVGHTHETALVRRPGGWILNPGSVGGGTLPSAATVMVMEPSRQDGLAVSWIRAPYDFDRFEKGASAAGIPEIFTRAVQSGRDPRGEWHTTDTRWRQRWAEQ